MGPQLFAVAQATPANERVLMVIKGSYDYLEENQKRIVRAKAGIEPDARVVSDGQGKSIHIDLHHGVNAVLAEEKRRLETERVLADAVHDAVRKKTAAQIQHNPDAFITTANANANAPKA